MIKRINICVQSVKITSICEAAIKHVLSAQLGSVIYVMNQISVNAFNVRMAIIGFKINRNACLVKYQIVKIVHHLQLFYVMCAQTTIF